MPNLKMHVEDAVWTKQSDRLKALLPELRALLCKELKVGTSACQLVIIPVHGLADQTQIAIELHVLPKADRTRDLLGELASLLQALVVEAKGSAAGVRITTLDPESYLAVR